MKATAATMNLLAERIANIHHGLLLDVAENTFNKGSEETDPERLLTGLDAYWNVASSPMFLEIMHNDRGEALNIINNMVGLLKTAFVDNRAMNTLPAHEVQGKLHELLWMLDGDIMILSDEKYKDLVISPAYKFYDRPIINRPGKNHGIDYAIGRIVYDRGTPKSYQLIQRWQLKSGSRDTKEYHPDIRLAIDSEFKGELDKRRLGARFKLYSDLIANGLQGDSDAMSKFLGTDTKRGYVLPSVRLALEETLTDSKPTLSPINVDPKQLSINALVQ